MAGTAAAEGDGKITGGLSEGQRHDEKARMDETATPGILAGLL